MAAMASEPKPLVWFIPEKRGLMVTLHACWGADFGGETAVFPTEAEAVAFCHKRWKCEPRVNRRGAADAEAKS